MAPFVDSWRPEYAKRGAGRQQRIRNPLLIPAAAVDALVALGGLASSVPQALAEIDARAQALMVDIAAMRAAVEPLDGRMRQFEREMREMHESLRKGMKATEDGMKETAKLQDVTNQGIGDLVSGVEPLGGGITNVEENTSPLPAQIGALETLMAKMLDELSGLRESLEPVKSAAEPVARLRDRLPGAG